MGGLPWLFDLNISTPAGRRNPAPAYLPPYFADFLTLVMYRAGSDAAPLRQETLKWSVILD